jgi:hypothetical protein
MLYTTDKHNSWEHTDHKDNKRTLKLCSNLIKLSVNAGDQRARTASFGIIEHQMCNWE